MLAVDMGQQANERREVFWRLDEMKRCGEPVRYVLRMVCVIAPSGLEKRVNIHFWS